MRDRWIDKVREKYRKEDAEIRRKWNKLTERRETDGLKIRKKYS